MCRRAASRLRTTALWAGISTIIASARARSNPATSSETHACSDLSLVLCSLVPLREAKDDEDEKRSEKDELETPEKKCAVVLG